MAYSTSRNRRMANHFERRAKALGKPMQEIATFHRLLGQMYTEKTKQRRQMNFDCNLAENKIRTDETIDNVMLCQRFESQK